MHNIQVARPIYHLGYIKMKYPEIFAEADRVVKQEHLTDWNLVGPIYRSMYDSTANPRENMHFFIAVLVELFDPTRRTCGAKFKVGLRDVISDAMGFVNPEMVNHFGKPIDVHMKNVRFFNKVIDTAQAYLDQYK
jgi:hypothetical protein